MAPKTPEQKVTVSRSFSAASAPNRTQTTAEIGATEGVETLFTHPHGKVVKFTSNAPTRPSTSSGTWSPLRNQQQQGTLAWATSTEKTMAAGPLEIYRVPGSVSFLHSGSLLHAILPRSNCWCVDGVSIFTMRVLPDTYYRIELPGETPDDLAKVEEFKLTLQKVLFYERTACPFARTFTVDLPEEGEPKPRRRRRRTEGPAKKWKFDKAYSWKPEGWTPEQGGLSEGSSGSATASDEEGSSGSPEEHTDELTGTVAESSVQTPPPARKPTVRDRARGIDLRSVTAPTQLSLQCTPSSRLRSSLVASSPATAQSSSSPSSRGERPPQSQVNALRDALMPRPIPNKGESTLTNVQSGPNASRSADSVPQHSTDPGVAFDHGALQPNATDMPPSPPDSNIGSNFVSTREPSPAQAPLNSGDLLAAEQSIIQHSRLAEAASTPVNAHQGSQHSQGPDDFAASSDQLETDPSPPDTIEVCVESVSSKPKAILQDEEDDAPYATCKPKTIGLLGGNREQSHEVAESNLDASFPEIDPASDTLLHVCHQDRGVPLTLDKNASGVEGTPEKYIEQTLEQPKIPARSAEAPRDAARDAQSARTTSETDPYAAIQARIQARRSIGETMTSFVPARRQITRLSATSTASSSSLRSQLSRRSQSKTEQDQVVATVLVRKAASAFLGPSVHLVAIMLKIAARFAKGVFPTALLFESPAGMPRTIPGSFDLDDSDIEEDFESEDELDEDDFGVPLGSPIRLASAENLPIVDKMAMAPRRGEVGKLENERERYSCG